MNSLLLFIRPSNLDAFQNGEDVVEVTPAFDPPGPECVLLSRVHFGTCPTCDNSGTFQTNNSGVTAWGPCPHCKQSKCIDP